MESLKDIAREATDGINSLLDTPFRPEQAQEAARIIEKAVIKALLEGQHSAVEACLDLPEVEQDIAHRIRASIRRHNDALIANLTSLR